MAILENESLKATVRAQGAELTSLFDKTSGTEHLWQGNPAVWGWHAPNLFPVVGACIDNQLLINGKIYPMERHGFSRQSQFTLLNSSQTQALFSLRHDAQTLAVYPYRFEFRIEYQLEGKNVTVTYRVINEDPEPVYFSVGGHPAFNVPFFPHEDYADYYLEFDADEKLERHLLSKTGYFTGQTEPVPTPGRKLALTKNLFDQDALVFKHITSRRVTIRSKNHSHSLSVSYPPFNYLGIWAKPGAPFVCIEPWLGCSDSEGKRVPIEVKEGIQRLEPGAVFEAAFTISIP